eukprot:1354906-Amorphochlora_amoeboformis.AAC.1
MSMGQASSDVGSSTASTALDDDLITNTKKNQNTRGTHTAIWQYLNVLFVCTESEEEEPNARGRSQLAEFTTSSSQKPYSASRQGIIHPHTSSDINTYLHV